MATPDYYTMMDAEKRQLQDAQATALKSETGPQTVTTVEPKTQAEGGMGYLHGGATPSKDTEIPGATKTAAEIAAGFTPAGVAIDVKDAAAAMEARDPVALAMAGFGFLPGLGDAAKALFKAIRGGDKSAETLQAAKKAMDEYKPSPRELEAQRTWQEGYLEATGKKWDPEGDIGEQGRLLQEARQKSEPSAKKRMIKGPSPHATMSEDEAMSALDTVIGRDQNMQKQLWDYWNSAAYAQGELPKIEGLDPKVAAAAQSFRPALINQLLMIDK